MLSRRFAAVVTIVIVVAFVVAFVAPAFASGSAAALPMHARLSSSTPADGATVKTADQVVLTFNEDVNPDFVAVKVTGPDGPETDGDPSVDGRTVTQALRGRPARRRARGHLPGGQRRRPPDRGHALVQHHRDPGHRLADRHRHATATATPSRRPRRSPRRPPRPRRRCPSPTTPTAACPGR